MFEMSTTRFNTCCQTMTLMLTALRCWHGLASTTQQTLETHKRRLYSIGDAVYLSRQDTYLHRLISGSQSFFFDLEFLRNVSEIALFSFIHSFICSE